jgi:hypothetical protein
MEHETVTYQLYNATQQHTCGKAHLMLRSADLQYLSNAVAVIQMRVPYLNSSLLP